MQVKGVLDKHIRSFITDLIGRQAVAVLLVVGFAGIGGGIMLIIFHPGRRTPGRGPDTQVGIVFLCAFNKRDQCLLVVGDGEVFHFEIAFGLIIGIPVAGEIVGTHRHTADGEIRPYLRKEEFFHDLFADCRIEFAQGNPAQFVEAGTETVYLLSFLMGMDNRVDRRNRIRRGRDQVGLLLPRFVFRSCYPGGSWLNRTGRED